MEIEITGRTTLLQVNMLKKLGSPNPLHEYLCSTGHALCGKPDLTIDEATRIIEKDPKPLIDQLNALPDNTLI